MNTQTIKIWKTTLKKLRLIHAETGESMVSIIERLAKEELMRIQLTEDDKSIQDRTRSE